MRIPDFSNLPVTISRWKFGKRQTIKVYSDIVSVTEMGLFTANWWEEPLSGFKGVLHRRHIETGGGEMPHVITLHLLELVHPNKKKTLRIYEGKNEKNIYKLWKEAADTLRLPALYQTDEGIFVQEIHGEFI